MAEVPVYRVPVNSDLAPVWSEGVWAKKEPGTLQMRSIARVEYINEDGVSLGTADKVLLLFKKDDPSGPVEATLAGPIEAGDQLVYPKIWVRSKVRPRYVWAVLDFSAVVDMLDGVLRHLDDDDYLASLPEREAVDLLEEKLRLREKEILCLKERNVTLEATLARILDKTGS